MSSKKHTRSPKPTPRPYPYKIPPVDCPSQEILNQLTPWHVLEFLRVEALLRTSTVADIYKSNLTQKEKQRKLYSIYRIYWDVFEGWHHQYLRPEAKFEWTSDVGGFIGPGVSDISVMAGFEDLNQKILNAPRRLLYVEIDTAFPSKHVLKGLATELRARHEEVPRLDLRTWLNYLTVYDLRTTKALSFGQIASSLTSLVGEHWDRSRADTSYDRCKCLIDAAEGDNWPPSHL